MKINYVLNEDNTIKDWLFCPFDESKPFIEIDFDPYEIELNKDKIINGEFIADPEKSQRKAKAERISKLKRLLADSDYLCLKHADGALTDEEYESIRLQRQAWRDEINELEA